MSYRIADLRRAEELEVTDDVIRVWLRGGRTLTVPLHWFPRLCGGTPDERNNWEADPPSMIYWPDLDETFTVDGLLGGGWSAERARTLGRWLLARQEGRGIEDWQIVEHHRSDPKPVPLA